MRIWLEDCLDVKTRRGLINAFHFFQRVEAEKVMVT